MPSTHLNDGKGQAQCGDGVPGHQIVNVHSHVNCEACKRYIVGTMTIICPSCKWTGGVRQALVSPWGQVHCPRCKPTIFVTDSLGRSVHLVERAPVELERIEELGGDSCKS